MKYNGTMIDGVRSASGNTVDQVHVTYFGDVRMYPMESRKDSHTYL